MATYLVTGGAGFIGTNLVIQLLDSGHTVRVLDNYAGGKKEERFQKNAEYIEGDIRDMDTLLRVMQGVDGVFHMAALPRVSDSVEKPKLTHEVNVDGTVNVLLAAKEVGVRRVVFSSSCAAYGEQPREVFPIAEDDVKKNPISPYALHKYIGEQYCKLFSMLYNLETVSLVYFNVYGPYMDPDGAYALVVGRFLKQAKAGEPMTICGDGEYYRDYTHVADIAKANILAMESERVGSGETINLGNDNPYSVNDIARLIGKPSIFVDPRPGDVRYISANYSKAKKLLGWEPSIELPEGIVALKAEMGIE